MASDTSIDATQSLVAHSRGDAAAADKLLPLVYSRLRALAARYMCQERPEHTLQPTALVHEAYVRLIDISRIDWCGKTHFFAMAAKQMQRVLIEHARKRAAKKRPEGLQRVTLDENIADSSDRTVDLLALQESIENLARRNRRQSQVAVLRLFAGLNHREAAYVLGVSERTVRQDWRVARAWLSRELSRKEWVGDGN